ncbi:MAG: Rab family GTPase [Promethearchaeota archaeon]
MARFKFNLMMLGDGGVGKTSLVRRFCKGVFSDGYKVTIGVDFMVKELEFPADGEVHAATLILWDVAGQKQFASMRRQYFGRAQAAIIMYDVTNPRSLQSVFNWKMDLYKVKKVPLILVGNKIDLDYDKDRVHRQANALAAKMGVESRFTSAKDGTGMDEIFTTMVLKIYHESISNS